MLSSFPAFVVRHYFLRARSTWLDTREEAAMLSRDVRARMQAPPQATLRRSLGLSGGNCAGRRLDSTTKEEGD